jgi:5-methylcytosine-specific restriction endonuclease McrA
MRLDYLRPATIAVHWVEWHAFGRYLGHHALVLAALFVAVLLFRSARYRRRSHHSKEYESYIRSAEWRANRLPILSRDHYKCRCCGTARNLQVHHLSYVHLGHEFPSELMTLCTYHHKQIHSFARRTHQSIQVATVKYVRANSSERSIPGAGGRAKPATRPPP